MWTSRHIHGHVELKASTYALAHHGCDAMAEIEAVGAQRLAGEKQMMGGGEDVGVAGDAAGATNEAPGRC